MLFIAANCVVFLYYFYLGPVKMSLGVALVCGCSFSSTARVVLFLHSHRCCFSVALLPCSPHFPTPISIPNPPRDFLSPQMPPAPQSPWDALRECSAQSTQLAAPVVLNTMSQTNKNTTQILIFPLSKHLFPTLGAVSVLGKIGITENIDTGNGHFHCKKPPCAKPGCSLARFG